MEQPKLLEITKIVNEAKDFKTFIFEYKLNARPGQFVMAWLPGIDEKPFSVSFQDKERFGITVMKAGKFTKEMFRLKTGDRMGIRGPYGRRFGLDANKIVLVGGGCGGAPLGFLAEYAHKKGIDVSFIIGARCDDYLLFLNRMKMAGIKVLIATDDGSSGFKGFTTDLLRDFLGRNKADKVYACGPEIMLKKLIEVCDDFNVDCEISMERYMKCGIGICGQCCIDESGARVCVEGPVFSKETVKEMIEFGNYKRSKSGRKVHV